MQGLIFLGLWIGGALLAREMAHVRRRSPAWAGIALLISPIPVIIILLLIGTANIERRA